MIKWWLNQARERLKLIYSFYLHNEINSKLFNISIKIN